jgi:hypothetical protein
MDIQYIIVLDGTELLNRMRCFFTQAKQFDLNTLALFRRYEQKKNPLFG